MELNRVGTTRDVLLLRAVAIKFPKTGHGWRRFIEGILANMNEVAVWQCERVLAKDEDRAIGLAPILWHSWGGWIVVMRRCERYPCAEVAKAHRSNGATTDHHHMNYGLLKGRVVCLDYA